MSLNQLITPLVPQSITVEDLQVDGNANIAGSLSVSGAIFNGGTINVSLVPSVDNSFNLGAGPNRWQTLYLGTDANIDGNINLGGNLSGSGSLSGTTLVGSTCSLTQNVNQLTMGNVTTTTLSATAPASNAIYAIPDVGTTGTVCVKDSSGNLTVNQLNYTTLNPSVTSSDTKVTNTVSGAFADVYVFHISALTVGSVTKVSIHLPADVQPAAANALLTFDAGVSAPLIPTSSSQSSWIVQVDDNSVLATGLLSISPAGVMTLGVGPQGDPFTNAGNCGIPSDLFIQYDLSSNA